MKRIAQRHGRSAAQVLLRHALQHGTATVAADFGELLVEIGRMSLKLWWIIVGFFVDFVVLDGIFGDLVDFWGIYNKFYDFR